MLFDIYFAVFRDFLPGEVVSFSKVCDFFVRKQFLSYNKNQEDYLQCEKILMQYVRNMYFSIKKQFYNESSKNIIFSPLIDDLMDSEKYDKIFPTYFVLKLFINDTDFLCSSSSIDLDKFLPGLLNLFGTELIQSLKDRIFRTKTQNDEKSISMAKNAMTIWCHSSSDRLENQDFSGIKIPGVQLKKGRFKECLFSEISIAGANLRNVTFDNCKFINANISRANLSEVSFFECQFINADFSGVSLQGCCFNSTLTRCNMADIELEKRQACVLEFHYDQVVSINSSSKALLLKDNCLSLAYIEEGRFIIEKKLNIEEKRVRFSSIRVQPDESRFLLAHLIPITVYFDTETFQINMEIENLRNSGNFYFELWSMESFTPLQKFNFNDPGDLIMCKWNSDGMNFFYLTIIKGMNSYIYKLFLHIVHVISREKRSKLVWETSNGYHIMDLINLTEFIEGERIACCIRGHDRTTIEFLKLYETQNLGLISEYRGVQAEKNCPLSFRGKINIMGRETNICLKDKSLGTIYVLNQRREYDVFAPFKIIEEEKAGKQNIFHRLILQEPIGLSAENLKLLRLCGFSGKDPRTYKKNEKIIQEKGCNDCTIF